MGPGAGGAGGGNSLEAEIGLEEDRRPAPDKLFNTQEEDKSALFRAACVLGQALFPCTSPNSTCGYCNACCTGEADAE